MNKKLYIFLILIFTVSLLAAENIIFSQNYSLDNIENLEINLKSESIKIIEYYANDILVEIDSNTLKNCPEVFEKDNTLKITSVPKSMGFGYRCIVNVYVPHESNLNSIKNFCSSGTIYAENLFAEQIELKASSGTITCKNIECVDFTANVSSGNVTLTEISAEYFDVETSSGSINLELKQEPIAKSFVESKSGNIKLSVPMNSDFDIRVRTNSGSFVDELKGFKGNHCDFQTSYGNGGALIDLKTSSGSVKLIEY